MSLAWPSEFHLIQRRNVVIYRQRIVSVKDIPAKIMQRTVDAMDMVVNTLKQNESYVPPVPKVGRFYKTLNSSFVYVFNVDEDGDAEAVILRGGISELNAFCATGSCYNLTSDGYHRDIGEIGAHLVMTLKEEIEFLLPA
jgi:hypothetical protein